MNNQLRPALIGGGLIGVLSGIPIINMGNCLCCGWVIAGGVLASYLVQKDALPGAPNYGNAAVLGASAGAIGAVISSLVGLPFSMLMSSMGGMSFSPEQLQEAMGGQEIPPAVASMLETFGTGGFTCVGFMISLGFSLVIYTIFGAIGSMIGTAVFAKK